MRTGIGTGSLHQYGKCTSIALQHAYQHTVCSRTDIGRRRVNPNADRVSRVAHASLRFGRLGTIAAAPPTRHATPNSMPFDDLAARRQPDRFSATMHAALRPSPCDMRAQAPRPSSQCVSGPARAAAALWPPSSGKAPELAPCEAARRRSSIDILGRTVVSTKSRNPVCGV